MHIETKLNDRIDQFCQQSNFSGVVLAKQKDAKLIELTYGYSNRAEELANTIHTKFGIASGCKLFTAIAVCQLVEKGLLTFDTRLKDCLNIDFPNFEENISLHQLLTHTSGVPDYFDEEVMDDFEELWKENPMYQIRGLKDFLPLFQNGDMMFTPGERFHYNNAGYILLGLIVEQKSGLSFTDYIVKNIFEQCGMKDSGYFSLDCLPKNTALGYIDKEDGSWRTNIYSIPVKGGSDGGAFVTASDMLKLWDALLHYKLLSQEMTDLLITPHVHAEDDEYYGYGIWISKRESEIYKYHVMGYDPGVSFASSYYPDSEVTLVIPSNQSYGPHDVTDVFEENM
ncbi:serine hydrolase [Fredinandcohnia sp. QZ13]|uniref:serine hydrolase domain-containing protein n=1 Tax=Fredinandcohnia sp. QZ13 TaxID=3073144 RepID=UPI00285350BE|nr:serine hydrolase [Fredinandcohnia sp. QZ13]MDR4889515.1 serine hydrolase [Fredinandcohnia sp. QZ13]